MVDKILNSYQLIKPFSFKKIKPQNYRIRFIQLYNRAMLNSLGIMQIIWVILGSILFFSPAKIDESNSLNSLLKMRIECSPMNYNLIHDVDSLTYFQKYLRAGKCVNSDDPEIKRQAEKIIEGYSDESDKVNKLFLFVISSFNDNDCESYKASDILKCNGNLCHQRSILLTALCRSVGVPARLHLQKVTIKNWHRSDGTIADITFAHSVTGIYINGNWHLYESVGNKDKWIVWTQDASRGSEMPIKFYPDCDCLFKSDSKIIIENLPNYYADRSDEMIKFIKEIDGDVRY